LSRDCFNAVGIDAGGRTWGCRSGFERATQVVRRVKPLLRRFLKATAYHACKHWRNITTGVVETRGISVKDGTEDVGKIISAERTISAQHFVEHCAEGEDVTTSIGGQAAHLFRRHVAHGSQHLSWTGLLVERNRCGIFFCELRLYEFGQSKIEDLNPAILEQKKILRLKIAVDDSFFVGGG
jgi:hypothetical protein